MPDPLCEDAIGEFCYWPNRERDAILAGDRIADEGIGPVRAWVCPKADRRPLGYCLQCGREPAEPERVKCRACLAANVHAVQERRLRDQIRAALRTATG
jgi:hypothetical protein